MRRPLLVFVLWLSLGLLVLTPGAGALTAGEAVLQTGATGEEVRRLQAGLDLLGLDPGPVDGIFGPQTEQAVLRAQQRFGLAADGRAGPELRDRIAALAAGEHQVSPGETLSGIAAAYGLTVAELIDHNDLPDPDLLWVGQRIRLAPAAPAPLPAAPVAPAEPAAAAATEVASVAAVADERPAPVRGLPLPDRLRPGPQINLEPGESLVPVRLYTALANPDAAAARGGRGTLQLAAPAQRIALTFNGGPDPDLTPQVLQTLARYNMQATFFVHGEAARAHPDLVEALVAAGHEVANNGWSRHAGTAYADAVAGIAATARAVQEAAGVTTLWFRPPGARLEQSQLQAAEATGHRMVLWTSVGVRDHHRPGRAVLTVQVLDAAFPGAIIMLHDSEADSVAALPGILEALAAKGIVSVNLSALLQPAAAALH